MNDNLYDFPMSWSCWRGICQSNGWKVPPPDRPELPSFQEYRQEFIDWQCQQQEMMFGYSSKSRIPSFKESISPRPMLKKQHKSITNQHTVIDI